MDNNSQEWKERGSFILGIIIMILFFWIVGSFIASIFGSDTGIDTNSNDFNWNDPEDVGGFMNYLDENDKRDFNGYKIDE